MKYGRAVGIFMSIIVVCASTGTARAATLKPTLLIVEVQTGSKDSTGEDFVELFNQSEEPVDLTTIRLEYLSTGTTSRWSKKATLLGALPSHDRYLVTTKDYLPLISDANFSSGMSKTGGSLRLVQVGQNGAGDITLDLIGWGTAKEFMGDDALPGPDDGVSLKRSVDEEGVYLDTDDNRADFVLSTSPSPSSSDDAPEQELDPEVPVSPTTPGETDPTSPDPVEESIASTGTEDADIWITELFADPASPQTDADDEFIELYNPSYDSVDLSGYVLQTGLTYSHSFVIASLELAPQQYQTLSAHETKLSLSNTGSRARLVGPSGKVISETPAYEKAEEGQSFALGSDNTWHWTTTVTLASANTISLPVIPAPKTTGTTSTTKKTTTKKATTKSTAKTASPKAASTKATKSGTSTVQGNAASSSSPHLNTRWLVGLGSLALLYAGWEYRDDIKTRIEKLRGNFSAGRKNRPEP